MCVIFSASGDQRKRTALISGVNSKTERTSLTASSTVANHDCFVSTSTASISTSTGIFSTVSAKVSGCHILSAISLDVAEPSHNLEVKYKELIEQQLCAARDTS